MTFTLVILSFLSLLATVVVVSCCVVSARISRSRRATGPRPLPEARPAMCRRLA